MRQALRTKGRQRQVSVTTTVPAPVGGWNTRDSLAAMPPEDAIILKNFFPTTEEVEIRGGSDDYTTVTGVVKTLATYTGLNGTEQFFAVTDTDCYDISTSTASAETWTNHADGKYNWLNMGDGTNEWLLMFNGVDLPKYYDGSTWTEVTGATSPAITGVTTTGLISACTYHGRLFLIEKDKLGFWYLPAGVVGGAATYFDLSPFASKGGYVMWAATWTFDAGDGIDDYIAFMTSEGQVLLYTGTDPSTAANWARVGTYYIGDPIGRRSFLQFGGDLLAITRDGIFPMSEGIKKATINDKVAITDKIKPTFTASAVSYGSNFGWEGINHSDKNAIIFNIPFSATESQQYVMNSITGSWCQFTGWNAQCFGLYNNELYYGESGKVQKAWVNLCDCGANIIAEGQSAFNNFGSASQNKRMTLFRPMLTANGIIDFLTDVEVDFQTTNITGVTSFNPDASSAWDTGVWDEAVWGGGRDVIRRWTSPDSQVGYYFSGKLKVETNTVNVTWIANDYVYETGGII